MIKTNFNRSDEKKIVFLIIWANKPPAVPKITPTNVVTSNKFLMIHWLRRSLDCDSDASFFAELFILVTKSTTIEKINLKRIHLLAVVQ